MNIIKSLGGLCLFIAGLLLTYLLYPVLSVFDSDHLSIKEIVAIVLLIVAIVLVFRGSNKVIEGFYEKRKSEAEKD